MKDLECRQYRVSNCVEASLLVPLRSRTKQFSEGALLSGIVYRRELLRCLTYKAGNFVQNLIASLTSERSVVEKLKGAKHQDEAVTIQRDLSLKWS
jgi:hypothetical protein